MLSPNILQNYILPLKAGFGTEKSVMLEIGRFPDKGIAEWVRAASVSVNHCIANSSLEKK